MIFLFVWWRRNCNILYFCVNVINLQDGILHWIAHIPYLTEKLFSVLYYEDYNKLLCDNYNLCYVKATIAVIMWIF